MGTDQSFLLVLLCILQKPNRGFGHITIFWGKIWIQNLASAFLPCLSSYPFYLPTLLFIKVKFYVLLYLLPFYRHSLLWWFEHGTDLSFILGAPIGNLGFGLFSPMSRRGRRGLITDTYHQEAGGPCRGWCLHASQYSASPWFFPIGRLENGAIRQSVGCLRFGIHPYAVPLLLCLYFQ